MSRSAALVVPLLLFIFLQVCSCSTPEIKTGEATTYAVTNDSSKAVSKQRLPLGQDRISAAYAQAIAEYIKAVYKNGKELPDTLFIGKHEDLPDIDLPAIIQNANIALITNEEAQQKLQYRSSLVFLNVMGWIDETNPEFLVVTFFENKPQHNCNIYLERNINTDQWDLDSLNFEYPYGRQLRNH
ncbi:hypothetical protein [Polluticoccus soli]|uniref:hypothetical protein n=1 Tax=Polluticoccus soli TaxID=3034150 RepID=UPI0023E16975|nr:hypothetical protein [Flavipsychrobacter sp. JY13-12]